MDSGPFVYPSQVKSQDHPQILYNTYKINIKHGGRDSRVRTVTAYGMGNLGIESTWGRVFPYQSRLDLAPQQSPVPWEPFVLPGVMRPGHDFDHPPSSSAKVKERVEL